ncbi:MAG: OadG family transporter subunit [Kiritimatiellia bacterium]|jgi:sodium pump decarboxylase gamma subunit
MAIINQGFILMVTGMIAVFIFLALLVYVVTAFESIAPKICHILPDPEPKAASAPKAKPAANPAIAVAIAAAHKRAGK